MSRLKLTALNLSSNKLTGRIPIAFDKLAYKNSFWNNPDLCASSPISNLQNCNANSLHSQKFPPKIIAVIVFLSAFIMFFAILYTMFIYRKYLKKKHIGDLPPWKVVDI
ncbi:hypothetical protein LXL04_027229 [Taraxacum kok-saghyz]